MEKKRKEREEEEVNHGRHFYFLLKLNFIFNDAAGGRVKSSFNENLTTNKKVTFVFERKRDEIVDKIIGIVLLRGGGTQLQIAHE